jgi:threonine aldolase
MDVIDLRSDTVTHPTPAMREAMAHAQVGDDVFHDDPTVNQLEQDAADMFGKEAGLFVSSGTQGNLIAMMAHCQRGEEVIVGDKCHTYAYEQGGIAQFGGIAPHPIPVQPDGTLSLEDIEGAIRPVNYHFAQTRLVTVENTQNTMGGVPLSPAYMHAVTDLAHRHGMKMHIDGARIFNAIAAYQTTAREMMGDADSLTFCLSKGLCAPVGSVLVGDKAFIDKGRWIRKALGGGMRQVGVLAAAGLIGLHEMTKRLHIDHENAALLAEGLSAIRGITVTAQNTNFIFFELNSEAKLDAAALSAALKARNIIINAYPTAPNKFRLVTHYWITRERVEQVLTAIQEIMA